MANWNLAVNLRGQGTSLAQTLRTSATHARTLSSNVRDARGEVRQLGLTARTTRTELRGLATQSSTTALRLGRLETQAGRASRGLRRLATQAGRTADRLDDLDRDIRIRIDLDDQTGGGATSIRALLADLGSNDLRLNATLDADGAAAAALALRAVQDAAQDTSRALRTLRGRAAATAASLDDLRARALLAAGGLRSLNTTARTADGRLTTLGDRTRTLTTHMGDLDGVLARLTGRMGNLRGSVNTTGSAMGNTTAQGRGLLVLAGMLGSALLPIAAATVPIAAGLGAAGGALGAFGLAIAGQIKALTDAAEAQTKYDEAVREHGAGSPEAAQAELEQIRVLKDVPTATREAAASYEVLTDRYKDWSNELAGDTMPVATKSMGLFTRLLDATTPLARGASHEVDRFMTIVGGGMATDEFDEFIRTFTTFAVETLARANSGIVRLARGLNTGEIGGNLREFLDYARENGPLVADTLSQLFSALLKLVAAGSDVGVSMLTVVNAIAQLVNAIPTGVLSTLLQVAVAFKMIQMAGMALGAVAPVMGTLAGNTSRFVRAARFGGVASAIAGVTQQLTLMQRASIALAVLTVVVMAIDKIADEAKGAPPDVDRLTTSLKALGQAGKFTGELKNTFGDMKGFVTAVGTLKAQTKAMDEARKVLDIVPGGGLVDWLGGKSNDIVNGSKSIGALTEDFKALDEGLSSLATSGHADLAADQFKQFQTALLQAGYSTEEIAAIFPQYGATVAGIKAEQDLAARSMGVFGAQAQETKVKLDAQKASADGLRASIQALNEVNRAALGGQIGFEQAIDDAAKAAKTNAGALHMTGGALDLNSQKARDAATALQDLGSKTDEAAAAAREANAPWEEVSAIYARGRAEIIKNGQAMGLTKEQAKQLAQQILDIPDEKATRIEMQRADALAGLDEVIAKIEATPGAKTVTVRALTAEAMGLLNTLGYTTKRLPNGEVEVTAKTGKAISDLAAVKAARDALEDRSITITTYRKTITSSIITRPQQGEGNMSVHADGAIRVGNVQTFADGAENHVAQIAPGGSWRVWAEPETEGEGYVPFAASKRPRSRRITEEIVRRLGGDPAGIEWNANGDVTDWRYDASSGSLYTASQSGQFGNKTRKVKRGKETVEVAYFDVAAVERSLKGLSRATQSWNRDLQTVADRVGGDVADALASMGTDGIALTKKMATGSTKYINDMSAALRGLAATAKASLTDYTRQLSKATTADEKFAGNLATLAARGYGDLARQLAAQGDQAAIDLAAAAVGDSKKAGAANTAAKKANAALTSDQVQQLVAIIAAISTSKTGIHDVAATTGLGEDDIIDVATRSSGQIKKSLGSRADKFLTDLARASKGQSYADGGIRSGIYATAGGAVTFAEPSTGGEAFIPLGAHKRRQALPVLREAAARMGVGLTDVAATRQVVVVKESGDTYVTVPAVRTGASASDIGAQVGRSVRRARRGGVAARA